VLTQTKTTLSDIITQRRKDLEEEMAVTPVDMLIDEIESTKKFGQSTDMSKNNISFKEALDNDGDVSVICEFKPASPSVGDISNIKLEKALEVFEKSGASAVSILTEEKYFKGSLNNLKSAHKLTELPIIRKDFIIDKYQIYQAKLAGANAVLLMNGIYSDIYDGVSICTDIGIDPMVECRNREDIDVALKSGTEILGINNRNLENFTVNLKTTKKLADYVPPEIILVSESGVKYGEDALQLSKYGVDAILIGTSIMGADGLNGMLNTATSIINAVKGERVVRNES
jgi:indole-3-glycerol phosphate synthase